MGLEYWNSGMMGLKRKTIPQLFITLRYQYSIIDVLIKSDGHPFLSFPRKWESRKFKYFWTPAFAHRARGPHGQAAGVTAFRTFYESIIIPI